MTKVEDKVESHHANNEAMDESLGRYSAYAMRLRTLLVSSSRYIAYSSDIGEAFRPLTRPIVVQAAYGISWAYIFADVGYTCYASCKGRELGDPGVKTDVAWIATRRAVFQTLARYVALLTQSLYVSALTQVVKYSAPVFAKSSSLRLRSIGPTVAGLLTVPLLPILFDKPVEHGVEHAFDLVELKLAAVQGNKDAQQALDDKFARMKQFMFGATSPTADPRPDPRQVDEIGSSPKPDLSTKSTTAAQLAVLGLGVDLVYMPRLRSLVSRHAKRMAAVPWQGAFATAPRLATPQRQEEQAKPETLLAAAAQHFARRTLSKSEAAHWASLSPCLTHEDRLRFLATRWACKEATYKAVYPHLRVAARDVSMARGNTPATIKPSVQLRADAEYKDATGQVAALAADALRLHLSVAHDGEYVMASVLAETL